MSPQSQFGLDLYQVTILYVLYLTPTVPHYTVQVYYFVNYVYMYSKTLCFENLYFDEMFVCGCYCPTFPVCSFVRTLLYFAVAQR